ncbi:MAG: UDP-N-acetylglucosamine 2-epimerase (non-hydrolyzing) [Bacteroidota bacterium]|nr:UDP-N-acetylglucosamine 2-epimerase (non-hydrolyzing) [Bacteroidota bacterium]
MKIVSIIGARPQFIKASAFSRAVSETNDVEEFIIHTGQHFDSNMSDVFFEQMGIPKPDINLEIHSLQHGAMTGRMLEKIEAVLLREKPDWVLVYGDTNSTLAGALAAVKQHIKLAHVEAGLRSFNTAMPEEINRILTDRISDCLFCPTDTAIENLTQENIPNNKLIRTGDVMYDSAFYFKQFAKKPKDSIPENFILATLHRAENTDNKMRLESIVSAMNQIANRMPIVLPLHPRTAKIMADYNLKFSKNIHTILPVGYLQMLWLLDTCHLVMTDSGGLQKEAYFFNKFCITLREETEWIELVENKINILCGANERKIISAFSDNINHKHIFPAHLYGEGNTANQILNELLKR